MNSFNVEDIAERSKLGSSKINELIEVAKQASTIGGKMLMNYYGNLHEIKSKGRVGDLVTEADINCEKEVITYLSKYDPSISILAEESGATGNNDGLCWCIDPLDGTTNFAHGYPFFGTSIGLMWRNNPLLGSISVPFLNETYWGAPGLGAFCNNNLITVSSTTQLIDSLLVTGFSYDRFDRVDNNYAEFCWLTHRTRGVRRGGAAAVDLAFVAAGRLDGYWERGLAKWDLAAGVAIVNLAGGTISDYKSDSFQIGTGRVLASAPGIYNELKQELEKVKPIESEIYGSKMSNQAS